MHLKKVCKMSSHVLSRVICGIDVSVSDFHL